MTATIEKPRESHLRVNVFMHRIAVLLAMVLSLTSCTVSQMLGHAEREILNKDIQVSISEAYGILLRDLSTNGYQILDADRDAAFIRAERERPSSFPWAKLYDVLSIIIIPSDVNNPARIQITASTDILPANNKRRPDSLSKGTIEEANRILALFPELSL